MVPESQLDWVNDEAVFTIRRRLKAPNQTYWASWAVKHREAKAWRELIRQALVSWLVERAVTRAQRLAIAPLAVRSEFPPAPAGRYRVVVRRCVRQASHFILDDDNLAFSVKPIHDALVRCGLIYGDDREHLERTIPQQCVVTPGEPVGTVIGVTPFWHPAGLLEWS